MRERLAARQRVTVSLDDLQPRIRCTGTKGMAQAGDIVREQLKNEARYDPGQSAPIWLMTIGHVAYFIPRR